MKMLALFLATPHGPALLSACPEWIDGIGTKHARTRFPFSY